MPTAFQWVYAFRSQRLSQQLPGHLLARRVSGSFPKRLMNASRQLLKYCLGTSCRDAYRTTGRSSAIRKTTLNATTVSAWVPPCGTHGHPSAIRLGAHPCRADRRVGARRAASRGTVRKPSHDADSSTLSSCAGERFPTASELLPWNLVPDTFQAT